MKVLAEHIGEVLRVIKPPGSGNVTGWRAMIAHKCGVSERAVEEWHWGNSAPGGESLIALFDILGPDFANAILSRIGLRVTNDAEETAAQDLLEATKALWRERGAL